jgi:hypothetical protein
VEKELKVVKGLKDKMIEDDEMFYGIMCEYAS